MRRRNETLEYEVETLRARLGEQSAPAAGAGGNTSINEVMDDLASMERLVNRSLDAGLDEAAGALKTTGQRRRTAA